MRQLSVILPFYNNERHLAAAIESVLNQTFDDFELILLDDGSSDSSIKIAESYAQSDSRVRLIRNAKNQGLVATLNTGINTATQTKYICRMDADDICEKTRFKKQIDFLNSHPEIAILGTHASYIDADGNKIKKTSQLATDCRIIECFLTRNSAVMHPTVMLRREVYEDFQYDQGFEGAEDYNIWSRASFKYKISNLPDKLLSYRIHSSSISQSQNTLQAEISFKIAHSYTKKRFNIDFPINFIKFYFNPRNYWYDNPIPPLKHLKAAMEKAYPDCTPSIKREFFAILILMFYTALTKKKFVSAVQMAPSLVGWISWGAASRLLRSFIDRIRL